MKKHNKVKKVIFICLIILMFAWATTAFAVALDIDVLGLTRTYLTKMVVNFDTAAQLEAEKQKVKQDTLDYVTQYKSDLTKQLNDYQKQELESSKQELNKTFVDLKQQLDDSKQQMLDEYKQKVKTNIDQEKTKKEQELRQTLNTEITNIFNQ